jgi:hypothetical protein
LSLFLSFATASRDACIVFRTPLILADGAPINDPRRNLTAHSRWEMFQGYEFVVGLNIGLRSVQAEFHNCRREGFLICAQSDARRLVR